MLIVLSMDGYLKPFRGSGDDFEVFWQEILIVVWIQKRDAEDGSPNKPDFLPMLFSRNAFYIWSQMPDNDKEDLALTRGSCLLLFASLKRKLTSCFELTSIVGVSRLKRMSPTFVSSWCCLAM